MAIQTEAVIVPVTVLGMEDMIGVLCDIPAVPQPHRHSHEETPCDRE